MKLYETVAQLAIVDDWLDEHLDVIQASGGEIPEALAALIDQAEGDFAAKVERVGLYIRELDGDAAALEAEIMRLQRRHAGMLSSIEGLKGYLKQNLEASKQLKVKTPLLTVSVQQNSTPSMTETPDDATVATWPDQFVTVIPPVPAKKKLNREALVAAFKAAAELPPGVAFKHGTHLRIR